MLLVIKLVLPKWEFLQLKVIKYAQIEINRTLVVASGYSVTVEPLVTHGLWMSEAAFLSLARYNAKTY